MKIPDFLKNEIESSQQHDFEKELIIENIRRGVVLAHVVIVFETILILTDIITSGLKVDGRFAYTAYLIMYSLMVAVNVFYLFILKNHGKKQSPLGRKYDLKFVMLVYITFVMSWGSVISLMDQRLFGQLITFMVNMIVCSVIYLLDNKKILIPYAISVLTLVLGLPFFQKSSDILIGHYVNLVVFVSISWLSSRILYHNYCRNYSASKLLENEILENKKINAKLAAVNKQLQRLALVDELTCIPNRRSFREFIERAYEENIRDGATLSIIMIDIDFFKQFNDSYGHEEGDKTLIAVAAQINAIVEDSNEFAVRWGGEEFIFAAFNRSQESMTRTADVIGKRVASLQIPHETSAISPYVTVSMGSCTIPLTDKRDVARAINLSDRALYRAKSSGRNCIITSEEESDG